MNRLNPIYILALILTFFIMSYVLLEKKKVEYINTNNDLSTLKIKAKTFKAMKESWFNKKKVEIQLEKIIKNPIFKKEKILKTQNSSLIKVKIESLNQKILNKFLNKVLNEKIIIKKLELKKTSIYFEVETK